MSPRLEWFGQAGHFIGANNCRFHLHTHVNGYCVSTVGEYYPRGRGEPQEEVGHQRLYETMVFPLIEDGTEPASYGALEMRPYNDRDSANAGHLEAVKRWGAL
jgi:hypothetical protein